MGDGEGRGARGALGKGRLPIKGNTFCPFEPFRVLSFKMPVVLVWP